MPSRPATTFSLHMLRRSARLATLVLAIFLLRVAVVAACAPADIAELATAATHADTRQHVATDAAHASSSELPGHCTHCSCHHAVALFVAAIPATRQPPVSVHIATSVAQATAPPERSLRPPIA